MLLLSDVRMSKVDRLPEMVWLLTTLRPVRLSELTRAVFRAFDSEQLLQVGALPTPAGENVSTKFPRSPAWLLGRPRPAIEGIVQWFSELLAH